jgi:hypothetical protein
LATSRPDNLGQDLSAYLDGELSEERAREIERLLAERPELRQQLEALRDAANRLARLPRLRAPDALVAAMQRAAERNELFSPRRPVRGGRLLRLSLRLTAAAAVLLGGVVVGWQIMHPVSAPGPSEGGTRYGLPEESTAARKGGRVAMEDKLGERDTRTRGLVPTDMSTIAKAPDTARPTGAADELTTTGLPTAPETTIALDMDEAIVTGKDEAAATVDAPVVAAAPAEPVERLGMAVVHADDDEPPADVAMPRENTTLQFAEERYAYGDVVLPQTVDVVVRTRDLAQFQAVCAVLGQTAPVDKHQFGAQFRGVMTTQPAQQLVWTAPPSEVPALLSALEAEAPERVWVDGRLAGESSRMKIAGGATTAAGEAFTPYSIESLEPSDIKAGVPVASAPAVVAGAGGRGGGSVRREGEEKEQPTLRTPVDTEQAEAAGIAMGGAARGREAPPPPAAPAASPARRGARDREEREAAPARAISPAASQPAEERAKMERGETAELGREVEREMGWSDQTLRRLRDRDDEPAEGAVREAMRRLWLGFRRSFTLSAPPPPPAESQIMIRVTVEPPTEGPASQPSP